MLEEDLLDAAEAAARAIVDSRVRHFFDAEKRAGKTVASTLGGEGRIAWDIYLFYPKGSLWEDQPPVPRLWMHQLTRSVWANAAHQYRGVDLVRELDKSMRALGFASAVHVDE